MHQLESASRLCQDLGRAVLVLVTIIMITPQGVNHVKHMAAGALAACVSRTIVAPFERVKMDCILRQRGAAATKVALGVLRNEGILGFWHGNGLNILRTAPYKVSLTTLRWLLGAASLAPTSSGGGLRPPSGLHSGKSACGKRDSRPACPGEPYVLVSPPIRGEPTHHLLVLTACRALHAAGGELLLVRRLPQVAADALWRRQPRPPRQLRRRRPRRQASSTDDF